MKPCKWTEEFDVIVIGGGHAGVEAAGASARMGAKTLLLTGNIDTIGQMSCNPAIGGIGKGHLVREVDALGGYMGRLADMCGIHYRTLNARKGAAVRASRGQMDRMEYRRFSRELVENEPNLYCFQQSVVALEIYNRHVVGAVCRAGMRFGAPSIVLTAGTFLDGVIHVGQVHYQSGRAGEPSSTALARQLRALGIWLGRMKTGTPPRIDARSLDYSAFEEQPSDQPEPRFSFDGQVSNQMGERLSCWITRTNTDSHEIIRGALAQSPVYSGAISGSGPRYCPSIEDKVVRFGDRDGHQVFLEPEGLRTREVYPNGISTSLPFETQVRLVRSMRGCSAAHLTRPGYAIEYGYLDPRQLYRSLESRQLGGLFVAGQLNGTTGYEEAAAQGLLAGINAALIAGGKDPWVPGRDNCYLGVMVDDLVTQGVTEPYRMFTSRAEYRLFLREDNADRRLGKVAIDLGLLSTRRVNRLSEKIAVMASETAWLRSRRVDSQDVAAMGLNVGPGDTLAELLRRPEVDGQVLRRMPEVAERWSVLESEIVDSLVVDLKYAGYVHRQHAEIQRLRGQEGIRLPEDLDYRSILGLSNEVKQKLEAIRPETLAQAGRISGMTPAAISLLLVHLKRFQG